MKQFFMVLSVLAFATVATNAKALLESKKDETKTLEWILTRTTSTDKNIGSSSRIEFIDTIEEFKAANPGIEPVRMTREVISGSPTTGYRVTYRLGSPQGGILWNPRINFNGYKNYQHTLTYQGGPAARYVEVQVDQTSLRGGLYVVGGGINQTYLRILVEALQTNYFYCNAYFYG